MTKCVRDLEVDMSEMRNEAFSKFVQHLINLEDKYDIEIEFTIDIFKQFSMSVFGNEINILKFLQEWYFECKKSDVIKRMKEIDVKIENC